MFDFDAIYARYPTRPGATGKGKGIDRLKASVRTAEDFAALGAAVDAYAASRKGHDPQFTKQFATWANCWRDPVNPATKHNGRKPNGLIPPVEPTTPQGTGEITGFDALKLSTKW